ncbi:SpoIID/LytB domain-containing protein [Paenibacillus typhae]|nr:SpoIID/LytB domain-containing protein [Paenibacillus typhae]
MKDERNLKYYGCAGDDQCVKVIDFLEYCKHVLPNEWDEYAPDESLKAGAMAVKMYAWYKVAVTPSAQIGEADVYDSTRDQKFLADLTTIGKKPEDIAHMQSMFHEDKVAGAGFVDNMGKLILAEYGNHSPGKSSGLVSQKQSTALAKQEMDFEEILRYYYDRSPKTMDKGTIGFFRYTR